MRLFESCEKNFIISTDLKKKFSEPGIFYGRENTEVLLSWVAAREEIERRVKKIGGFTNPEPVFIPLSDFDEKYLPYA